MEPPSVTLDSIGAITQLTATAHTSGGNVLPGQTFARLLSPLKDAPTNKTAIPSWDTVEV